MKDYEEFTLTIKDIIDEDDLIYEWDEVKDKYPNTSKEEFDLKQKQFQEV